MAKLYIISPPKFELAELLAKLDLCLATGKVGLFQLRMKEVESANILAAAKAIAPICQKHSVPFIMNDSAELALECGADGVHLGEESQDYDHARKLLGTAAHIGISCYADVERALDFANKGANLLSFGQFHPTKTKPPKGWATPQTISDFLTVNKNQDTQTSAIGGLNFENCAPVIAAGVDYICMVSAIWDDANSVEKIKRF